MSKNWRFSKGVNPLFLSKTGHFSNFFFLFKIGLENDFYDIIDRKNAFLGYKNMKFKKSKNWHFSKGVNSWFWSKTNHFLNVFFRFNIGLENILYDIIERINAFLGYKNKKFKKSKKFTHSFGPNKAIFPAFVLGNIG